ncbi:hypothetical protein Hanom_Chr11g00976401 [Helianthus anomalus]
MKVKTDTSLVQKTPKVGIDLILKIFCHDPRPTLDGIGCREQSSGTGDYF